MISQTDTLSEDHSSFDTGVSSEVNQSVFCRPGVAKMSGMKPVNIFDI